MNKRGQFFLLAAVVIIGVVFGLSTIYTTAEAQPQDETIYDLTKEIKYEANSVIDSGILNAKTDEEEKQNIKLLTDHYAQANLGSDLIILHGDRNKMLARFYKTQDTGSIGVDLGGPSSFTYSQTQREYENEFNLNGDEEITIVLGGEEDEEIRYTFDVKPGEMFFIVLKEEKRGEQFVSASNDQ